MRNGIVIGLVVCALAALCGCGAVTGGESGAENGENPTPATANAVAGRTEGDSPVGVRPLWDSSIPERGEQIATSREINEKVVGWLTVPGSGIDSAILQAKYTNDYYNEFNIYDEPDPNGTLFADFRAQLASGSSQDFSPVTTLYGHSFSEDPDGEGPMTPIKHYRDIRFAQEHPYLYFSTGEESTVWEVCAVFDAHVELPYNLPDPGPEEWKALRSTIGESSYFRYDAFDSLTDDERFLVLSCCTEAVDDPQQPLTDYRFAVMARLVTEGETLKSNAALEENQSRLLPDDAVTAYEQRKPVGQ